MKFELLQQWECVVNEVDDECVHCSMTDLTDLDNPEEYASIYLTKFKEEDRKRLEEGRPFYWNIARITDDNGNTHTLFELKLPKLKKLTKKQKEDIKTKAEELGKLFQQVSK